MRTREQLLLIDGAWVPGEGARDVADRWTGERIGSVAVASPAQATEAVDAAERALRAGFPTHARSGVLSRAAALVEERLEAFAECITAETGKPITAARTEAGRAATTLRFAAEESRRLPAEAVPLDALESGAGTLALTIAEPVGVVAAITPFNFPLNLVAHKIAPALAAGCPVVLKPAERTSLTAGLLAEVLLESGLPAGFLNVVTGEPIGIVRAWQDDPRVEVVTFTGSSRIGWMLKASSPRKTHILELGSNTAMIVAADADLDRAADAAATAALANSGQACISLQRLYVDASVADALTERIAARFRDAPTGDPRDPATVVGPLVDDVAVARVVDWVREAAEAGARIVTGGAAEGSVVLPTLVRDAPASARVVCEEVFGPVLTVVSVSDLDEAIRLANTSRYGLNTAIFTRDLTTALRYAREGQAGSVLVNIPPSFRAEHMPYGGVKESGQGREGVRYAVAEFTHQKLVALAP